MGGEDKKKKKKEGRKKKNIISILLLFYFVRLVLVKLAKLLLNGEFMKPFVRVFLSCCTRRFLIL